MLKYLLFIISYDAFVKKICCTDEDFKRHLLAFAEKNKQ